jgi:hypothetical protein
VNSLRHRCWSGEHRPLACRVRRLAKCIAMAAVLLLLAAPATAALQKDPGPIPPLRPPKGRIALDIPERTILRGSLGFALLVLVAGRVMYMRRPKIVPPELPAIVRARLALEAAPAGDIAAASHGVRQYLIATFPLGDEGATADELSERFAQQPPASLQSAQAVREFLVGAEHARFAPVFAQEFAEGCVERARELVEEIEAARVGVPVPQSPPPLPPPPPAEAAPPPPPPLPQA